MSTDTPAAAPTADRSLQMLGFELAGVIADVEQGGGFDAVCLETIKRVRAALSAPVAAQPAASGVDALWVDERLSLFAAAEALEVAAEDSDSIGNNSRAMGLRGHAHALREFADVLRTHLSTALTGAAKE